MVGARLVLMYAPTKLTRRADQSRVAVSKLVDVGQEGAHCFAELFEEVIVGAALIAVGIESAVGEVDDPDSRLLADEF